MQAAVRWLTLAAGVLILIGWTLPYTILFDAFSVAALVPPGHRGYLPWVGVLVGLFGIVLVLKAARAGIGVILPAAASTLLLILGVIHTHQIFLHKAPTLYSWLDAAWPILLGGAIKLTARKTG